MKYLLPILLLAGCASGPVTKEMNDALYPPSKSTGLPYPRLKDQIIIDIKPAPLCMEGTRVWTCRRDGLPPPPVQTPAPTPAKEEPPTPVLSGKKLALSGASLDVHLSKS
jgi:hypothetical protein